MDECVFMRERLYLIDYSNCEFIFNLLSSHIVYVIASTVGT